MSNSSTSHVPCTGRFPNCRILGDFLFVMYVDGKRGEEKNGGEGGFFTDLALE